MKNVEFVVPGKPQGKGRPRVVNRGGFSRAYTPSQTVLYENWIRTCYQSSTDYRFPDDTPLEMRIVARFAVPKSYSAKKRRACLSGDIRPTCKPDMDNIVKCVADALNGIAYRDDSRIFKLIVMKEYSTIEELRVQISEERKSFEQEISQENWGEDIEKI